MKVLGMLTAVFLAAFTCWAQSNQGTIYGTITDNTRSVIPAVQLTIINEATGLAREGTSNGQGDYRLDFIPPGDYKLIIRHPGFETTTLTGITLLVGQALRVDARLNVGSINEEVSIEAGATPLNTLNASRGEVMATGAIQNMPLNGREFLALATLVPGAVSGSRPLDNPRPAKGDYVVGYNGARATYNSYYVDGAQNTSPEYNNMISSPSVDAIQEFRIETSSYSSRYGQTGGAVISVVTKSGTNNFHGTLYEYHRNKVFDALPLFYNGTRKDFPNSLWNQFGGSIGGPIRKKSTFFFANAEFFRQLAGGQQMVGFAPTAAERVGDIRNSVNPWAPGSPVVLTNPYTGEVIPSGILPANLISPVGQKLMSLWPEPNHPENPYFNYRVFRPRRNRVDKYLGRVDHNFSSDSLLSATFNYGDYDTANPNFIDYGDKIIAQHDRMLTIKYTRIFNPTLVNEFGGSFSQYLSGDRFRLDDKNYGLEWGMDPSRNINNGSPAIQLFTSGFTPFFIGGIPDWVTFTRQGSVHDDLSWQKGSHTLQLGGMFSLQKYNWRYFSGSAGYLMNILDGTPGTWPLFGVTGSAFTNLLAAIPSVYQVGNGEGNYNRFSRSTLSAYLQDDWKVNQRLTLNLGLRWEYERPFSVADGKRMTIDPETGLVRYAKGAPDLEILTIPYLTDGTNLAYEGHPLTFMPRFGFALQPFKSSQTVLRGGYGIFFTSEPAWNVQMGSFINPFGGVISWWTKGIVGGWPDGDHLRTLDLPPYGYDIIRSTSPGNGFTTNAPDYPRGYVEQWNLTIGHDFGRGLSAEVAYVGSQGINLNGLQSLASYSPELNRKVVANYPGWGAVINTKGYNSNYNAFQSSVRKIGGNLNFLAAYTWSHALADASNDTQIENIAPDILGRTDVFRRIRSNAGFDVRHRFSLQGDYRLPFGRGEKWGNLWSGFLDKALGGWSVSVIYAAQSGFPFSVYTASRNLTDRICDGNLPKNERTTTRWFDYTCFPEHFLPNGAPSAGNSSTNIIRGPGFNNWDLGIRKSINFTDTTRLEFRVEAFNALNHPQLSSSFNGLNWFYNNPAGAEITTSRDPRQVQFAVRFSF
jgi:hypothetical protein